MLVVVVFLFYILYFLPTLSGPSLFGGLPETVGDDSLGGNNLGKRNRSSESGEGDGNSGKKQVKSEYIRDFMSS